MTQIFIRNVNERAIQRMKERAQRHGHSLQQELRDLIISAAHLNINEARMNMDAFRNSLAQRQHSDSTLLLRADRDR